MIEVIIGVLIILHILKHKASVLLNFNIKSKKIYVKFYDIWSRYPDKAIKLGDILYTASAKFYTPSIPSGLYFLENKITERHIVLRTIRKEYKIDACLLPNDLTLVLEDGSKYPYYVVSNGPSNMNVIIRKKAKMFDKPKELLTVTADQLVASILSL